jgi:hypothetical protein
MKFSGRNYLTTLFFGLTLAICACVGVVSFAQTQMAEVIEGERLGNIKIGKSTAGDVESVYGTNYKLVNHNKYSFEMIYKDLGLSFYYCQADPNKEIFVVEMEAPFKAVTKSGIVLGESTFADIYRIYGGGGSTYSEADYKGIYFYTEEDTDGDELEDARSQPQTEDATEVADEAETEEAEIDEKEITNFNRDNAEAEEGDEVEKPEAEEIVETEETEETVDNGLDTVTQADIIADDANRETESDKEAKSKIVRRFELVEESGLRQCSELFRKRKN